MKIVAKRKAFYKGEIIKIGQVLTIGNNVPVPTWAKKVNGKVEESEGEQITIDIPQPTPQPQPQQSEPQLQPETTEGEGATESEGEGQTEENAGGESEESEGEQNTAEEGKADDLEGKTEEELAEILNKLLDEGCEKGIMLEDTEKKTIIEQIKELQEKLGEIE